MSDKKKNQLGMNPSTASGRLVKDLLWSFIVKTSQNDCYKCSKPMSRETFSIEHKVPWLDSEDPLSLYFDLDNIAYSHLECNIRDVRRAKTEKPCGTVKSYKSGCRCLSCVEVNSNYHKSRYTKEIRTERYRRLGH